MEKLLTGLIGKNLDVGCGTSAVFRGEVVTVRDGVLHLRDENDIVSFIAIDKIASVREKSDAHSRPGFIG